MTDVTLEQRFAIGLVREQFETIMNYVHRARIETDARLQATFKLEAETFLTIEFYIDPKFWEDLRARPCYTISHGLMLKRCQECQ